MRHLDDILSTHAYGYKTEIAHLPNGLVVFISDTYAGSIHDFSIFKDNLEIYEKFLEKKGVMIWMSMTKVISKTSSQSTEIY